MKKEIITPILTILDENGKFDKAGNEKLIDYVISNGVDGILILGSSGEFNKFSTEEKKEIAKFYLDKINKRVKAIVGAACINYNETIDLANYSISNGADGVMLLSDLYFKLSQKDFFHYYDKLCKNINGDVYIYNYPANSGNSIDADTIYKIKKENDNLRGIKDTVSDFSHTKEVIKTMKQDFSDFKIYSGYDNQFEKNCLEGGDGNISALSNIVPDLWTKWVKAANDNTDEFKACSEKIDGLMELYSLDSNLFHIFKYMVKYVGLDISTYTMFPFDELPEEQINKGKEIIDKFYKK